MSKHFSCKDCCKYQTDACDNPKYAESGKHLCPAYVLDIEECYQKGYQKGKEDTAKLLFPFVECCDQEGICDEIMGLTVDEHGDTWCTERCNSFCEECVLKWLELKEKKND